MKRRSLTLIADHDADGRIVLRSPAVGLYTGAPLPGAGLVAGSVAGTLRVLGCTIDLKVPEGAEGLVAEVLVADPSAGVEYGQPLLDLVTSAPSTSSVASSGPDSTLQSNRGLPERDLARGKIDRAPSTHSHDSEGGKAAPDLAPGQYALRAPTRGIFYSRPDPNSAPFAAEGSLLEAGQTAGLIEVMKCFSPIVHPGGTFPSPAIVERVAVREGEEVHPGRVLFVLRAP